MLLIIFYTNLTIKGKSLHLSLGLQLLKSTDYIPNPNDIDLIQWTQSYLLVQWLYEKINPCLLNLKLCERITTQLCSFND